MNLEDHVGDVIRKARLQGGVSLDKGAEAAGISVAELESLEDTGRSGPTSWARLAALLGLNPQKLQRMAEGWLPAPVDLGRWRELRQISTSGPGFTVNCYLVWDEVTREAALFDTGFEAAPIFDHINSNGLDLRFLFVTHTHHDHIAAMTPIRERFPKVRIRTNAKSAPPEQRNRANDCISLGNLRITNRDTPGHAEDGVTYVIGNWPEDAPHVAVVGDAIFAGSMGKAVDQASLARQKIRDQILSLPPTTLICPGHGPTTTVGEQIANNPFF